MNGFCNSRINTFQRRKWCKAQFIVITEHFLNEYISYEIK